MGAVAAHSIINSDLLQQPGFKETYANFTSPPQIGDVFKNRDLAATLQQVRSTNQQQRGIFAASSLVLQIAAGGSSAFYSRGAGSIAERLVAFLGHHGGLHALEDFEEFETEWVQPLSSSYRGWTVHELPPNGQGMAALQMLNIMETFPLSDYGPNSSAALHVMIEAKKLAYADLAHVGDPRFAGPKRDDVSELVGKPLARERAMKIDMKKAASAALPSELKEVLGTLGSNTIYLSAGEWVVLHDPVVL
jgi:gamma-glutamyltranspeptidase/glutathione hydrolase